MSENPFPKCCLLRQNWLYLRVVQARRTYMPGLKDWWTWHEHYITEGYFPKLWTVLRAATLGAELESERLEEL